MAGKGGRRPGAGRPRKEDAIRRQPGPVRVAEEAFRDALPELAKVALSLALKDKNLKAVMYCLNRALGMPTQPVDVYDTARRLAEERGLDPAKVVSIFDGLKNRRAI